MTVPLAALIRRVSRMAEQMFDKRGDIDPIWLIESASGEQRLLVTPVVAPDALAAAGVKEALAAKMRELFAAGNVVRYVRATECWTAPSLGDGTNLEEVGRRYAAMGYTLANAPDRQEMIVIEAADGRELLLAKRAIVRPAHGKPYLGRLGEIERPDHIQGRFLDLLPRGAPHSEDVQ